MNEPGSNAATAIENANRSLAEYQKIRQWFLWPEADFPRTPTDTPRIASIREVKHSAGAGFEAAAQNDTSLAALIAKIAGHPVQLNSKSASLEGDLQLSSLDRVELMSALEERYQLQLNEVQFKEAATVGQLEKLLSAAPPSSVHHLYPTWPQNWLTTALRLAVYYLLAWPATYLLSAPRIRGREQLRGLQGPVLVVSNHVTYLVCRLLLQTKPARIRNRLATAMRGERLAEMRRPTSTERLFERFMERLRYFLALSLFNVFPLPRQSGFLQSFRFAGNLVDRHWNLLVFPEGRTT